MYNAFPVKAPSRIFPGDDLGSPASRTTGIVPFMIKRSRCTERTYNNTCNTHTHTHTI